jgi:hypothetical protein
MIVGKLIVFTVTYIFYVHHSNISLDVYFYVTVGEPFIKRVRVRVPLPGLTLLMI